MMWRLVEGCLLYGDEIEDGMKSPRICSSYIALNATGPKTNDGLKLTISPDTQYCAVYRTHDIGHVDVWGLLEGEPNICFTFRHNQYFAHECEMLVEFINSGGDTQIMTNTHHGAITFYDIRGQTICNANDDDKFINGILWLDDARTCFVLNVWYWHPVYMCVYYSLKSVLNDPKYEGICVWDSIGTADIFNMQVIPEALYDPVKEFALLQRPQQFVQPIVTLMDSDMTHTMSDDGSVNTSGSEHVFDESLSDGNDGMGTDSSDSNNSNKS
jgi:hypothetical protein